MLLTLLRYAGKTVAKKVEDASGGIMATIARFRRQLADKQEHEASIQSKQAEELAQQAAQKAEDERRIAEASEAYLAEMVAQGAEMRRRELERSANVLEFKPVINSGTIERSAEVVTSSVRQALPIRDASTEAEALNESDNLALILILLEAA